MLVVRGIMRPKRRMRRKSHTFPCPGNYRSIVKYQLAFALRLIVLPVAAVPFTEEMRALKELKALKGVWGDCRGWDRAVMPREMARIERTKHACDHGRLTPPKPQRRTCIWVVCACIDSDYRD
jgi:hypothetical protein